MPILDGNIVFVLGVVIGAIGGFSLAVGIGSAIRWQEQRKLGDLVAKSIQEVDDERGAQ